MDIDQLRNLLHIRATEDFYRIGLIGGGADRSPRTNFEIAAGINAPVVKPADGSSAGYIAGPSENAPPAIAKLIDEAAQKHGVPYLLLESIIWQESRFNPNDVNKKSGAMGLGQLMPKTAAWLKVKNPMDPRENLMGSAEYIKMMLNLHKNNIPLALAAYNAGPGNVRKHGGIPPFDETRHYVKVIVGRIKSLGGIVGYKL